MDQYELSFRLSGR